MTHKVNIPYIKWFDFKHDLHGHFLTFRYVSGHLTLIAFAHEFVSVLEQCRPIESRLKNLSCGSVRAMMSSGLERMTML